ncbi:MAG: hypothetical protein FJ265_08605 [Planctomycetes bacterium]|nr:hypothetical protein [Planctomycetota bacterium]
MHRTSQATWLAAGLVTLTAVLAQSAPTSPTTSTPPATPPLAAVLAAFAGFDLDRDGRPEIRTLELLHEAGRPGTPSAPLVLVIVEARLLAAGPASAPLRERLLRFAADLVAEGHRAAVVAAAVHTGPDHQDGRTLLALRRLLQAVHRDSPPLAHLVLVGHFPDALLVRTCNWRRNEPLELPGPDGVPVKVEPKTTNVRCVPEFVAHRCDVVLGDLDGGWEQVYVPGPSVLPAVTAVYGDSVPDPGGRCVALHTGELRVTDVFHVRDGAATLDREAFAVALDPADRDHECSPTDRTLGNPLAQPEVAISRLDARGVAWSPEPAALDADGRPRRMPLGAGDARQDVGWRPDPALELRLYAEYFDRNHAYRTAPLPAAHDKPASAAHGLGSGFGVLRAAKPAWREFAEPGYDQAGATDLLALAAWQQRPAVLRTLRAHSDPFGAEFARTDVNALERLLCGPPWRWRRDGDALVPSLQANGGGRADFWYYRSLHENRALPPWPYLLLHTGCEALSPPGACELPFDDPAYGRFAHAESILFFTPCLVMVGRAKVFYDEPRGFAEALAAGAAFGEAWRRYFAIEAAATNWDEVGGDIGRKRACFWSVAGDGTLRLR